MIRLERDPKGTIILLLSELVANSVRHSGRAADEQVEILILQLGDSVHVEVSDPGPGTRIVASSSLEHAGLRIVDTLSARWGVTHDPTTVWFDVAIGDRAGSFPG